MLRIFRLFIILASTLSLLFSNVIAPEWLGAGSDGCRFDYLEYPEQAVTDLSLTNLSDEDIKSRADTCDGTADIKGYGDVSGVMASPYYSAVINGTDVPVYSATAFSGIKKKGMIGSFSEIYIDKNETADIYLELTSDNYKIKNAVCLPESLGVKPYCKKGTMYAHITGLGIYTFLFNFSQQDYSFTLFVRENKDDDEQIAEYVSQYGEENVMVFDSGLHNLDYINIVNKDGFVIYLRRGAYLCAQHKYEINKYEDFEKETEVGAAQCNSLGITKYPFINFYNSRNVKLCGNGVIDLNRLDWHERRGVVFSNCEGVELSGVKVVNPPAWTVITYQCSDVNINNTDILGYRINSDAFAICNSQNVEVDNCFARSGDDLFDVKTLGGNQVSENIIFTNCIAWNGKARCFGICGEIENDIRNVVFKDCAVIWRDGTWNKDRIASLAIIDEIPGGKIENVTFENIEIYRDEGRAICCMIYEEDIKNTHIENVAFKNIKYTSKLKSKVYAGDKTNSVSISISEVRANGVKIKRMNSAAFVRDKYAALTVIK